MPPKDFFNLDDAAAEAFFAAFVARAGPRLAQVRREVAARGGPDEAQLDGSPDSLVGVWCWFVEHGGEAGGDELPPWYEPDPPQLAGELLAPAVVRDVDGLALVLADAFQRALPDLEWGIGREPRRMRYVAQNKPVLKGDGYDVDVLGVAYNLALRESDGAEQDPEALLRTFRAWVDPLTAGA